MGKSQKAGNKSKKAGRTIDSPAHKRYNAERRWIKHQVNRVVRYMKRCPNWKVPDSMNDEVKSYVLARMKM